MIAFEISYACLCLCAMETVGLISTLYGINHAREKYTLIYLVDDFSFLFHSSSRTRPTFSHCKMAKYSIATSIAMHFHKLHPEYPEKNSNSKIWWFSRCSHFSWNSIFIHKSHCHIVRFRFDISRAAFLAHTKFFCCFFSVAIFAIAVCFWG